ncbi:L,D-transpeptidase family protein [Bradyrhizobium brasilense]|uniref:L,D-transpeptidase family protein n=1 Tax=Bradyrhizobium TaxID=374 RepID=UPI001CD1D421|nr:MULTISPECIES: L,D-transpeptidase [Bradyrhizobium]MCA1396345.1 L,D-transpeptidase family protein [Bradyrhizobium sp. BRP56]WFU34830.1 L,D-transpeptidase family protein [Bradyrhizobium australafricanum]
MMINRILTICAAAALGVAGTSLAHAQQGYPAPQGTAYSTAPQPYPQGSMPDFDALNDDDGQDSAALPPPGPVLSPNDPRYGRPANAPTYSDRGAPTGPVMSPDDPRYGRPMNAPPVYSDRGAPTGPVMSPDDPRYGRPMGPPPVIYGDRPGAQQANRDNGVPAAGVSYGDDRGGMRPPEGVTGAVPQQQAPVDANGKPVQIAALPPDEQPEDAPAQLPPNLRRQEVSFATKEPAGTIVVDTSNTYLYYILGNGRAVRYGVRVGRDGFTWTGVQKITRKAEWPDWHPPTEMIERQPYLPRFMAGGPGNPLGARAMYLGSTVYRIHGTNQPSTIGKFVSSGCIGMLNEDVSDLFERAKVGTRVVVLPGGPPPGTATASAAPANPMAPSAAQAQAAAPLPGTQPTTVQPLPAPVTVR